MLGNWVYESERTRFPMRVEAIFAEDVYLDFPGNEGDVWESEEQDIMPIPLTEEIISNLRECDHHDNVYYISIGVYLIRFEKTKSSFRVHVHEATNQYERVEKVIKYVHELQNICKICGIDLKIEL